MKVCKKCNTEKDESEFYKANKNPDGLQYACKICQHDNNKTDERKIKRAADLKRRKQEATEYMRTFKNGPCIDCKLQYPPYVMQFDHRDPSEKEFTIGSIGRLGKSKDALHIEIAKCDLVCANCHAEREWQRKERLKNVDD